MGSSEGNDVLELFHPATRAWFASAFAAPTAAQLEAWPAIKAGRHALVAAPTGSGKTLAAFLAAIDTLVREGIENDWPYIFTDTEFEPIVEMRFARIREGFNRIRERIPKRPWHGRAMPLVRWGSSATFI